MSGIGRPGQQSWFPEWQWALAVASKLRIRRLDLKQKQRMNSVRMRVLIKTIKGALL